MSFIKMSLLNGENVLGFLDSNRERGHFLSQELTTFVGRRGLTKPEVKRPHVPIVQGSWSNCPENKGFH